MAEAPRTSFIESLVDEGKLFWFLLKDRRVPLRVKALPAIALIYALSPLDFIPDALPGIGQIDDLFVVLTAIRLVSELSPALVVNQHRAAIATDRAERKATPPPPSPTISPPKAEKDDLDFQE